MDRAEKVSIHQLVHSAALTGEAALSRKKRLQKLLQSSWFGRLDFSENGNNKCVPIYIGVHAYFDEAEKSNLIHDWKSIPEHWVEGAVLVQ